MCNVDKSPDLLTSIKIWNSADSQEFRRSVFTSNHLFNIISIWFPVPESDKFIYSPFGCNFIKTVKRSVYMHQDNVFTMDEAFANIRRVLMNLVSQCQRDTWPYLLAQMGLFMVNREMTPQCTEQRVMAYELNSIIYYIQLDIIQPYDTNGKYIGQINRYRHWTADKYERLVLV